MGGTAPTRRQGAPSRAGRRLGSRPPLVARPDGPDEPAARRANDARLARLVRHVERGRRLAEADDGAESPPPPLRARQLRPAPQLDHREPGDADLAVGHGQPQGRPERELRSRADGAVHARRGERLHRARRPRAGPGAHRLDEHVEAQQGSDRLPLRREAPRHRHEDRLRQDRAPSRGGTRSRCASTTRSTRRSSSRSSGATSSRSLPTRRPSLRSRRSTARASRSGRSSTRSSGIPRCTPGLAW